MKGTGEVLEEVVSRDTHNAINKVGHKSKLSQSIKGLWHRFQSKLARCFQFETLKVGTIFYFRGLGYGVIDYPGGSLIVIVVDTREAGRFTITLKS